METINAPISRAPNLSLRISPETIKLSTSCGTIDLRCPNRPDQFEHVYQLIQQTTISLVLVIENRGLEIPLVKWLRERDVDFVVLKIQDAGATLVEKIDTAGEAFSQAKLIVGGFATIFAGIMLTELGLAELPDGSPLAAGGLWKGPIVILLGVVLTSIILFATKRESSGKD